MTVCPAWFTGKCDACGGKIMLGDMVYVDEDLGIVHDEGDCSSGK